METLACLVCHPEPRPGGHLGLVAAPILTEDQLQQADPPLSEIDNSLGDFARTLPDEHPGRAYVLSKLECEGLFRQELSFDLGTQISVGKTRTGTSPL